MKTFDPLIGKTFSIRHGLGSSTYRVDSRHRDFGYYICVEIEAPLKALKGSIEIFHRSVIERALQGCA